MAAREDMERAEFAFAYTINNGTALAPRWNCYRVDPTGKTVGLSSKDQPGDYRQDFHFFHGANPLGEIARTLKMVLPVSKVKD